MFLHIYRLCPGSGSGFVSPYGSGSDFYYTNPQIRIRIRNTGMEGEGASEVRTIACNKVQILSESGQVAVWEGTRGTIFLTASAFIEALNSRFSRFVKISQCSLWQNRLSLVVPSIFSVLWIQIHWIGIGSGYRMILAQFVPGSRVMLSIKKKIKKTFAFKSTVPYNL